eukprot:2056252-Amphidinium_carterae.1
MRKAVWVELLVLRPRVTLELSRQEWQEEGFAMDQDAHNILDHPGAQERSKSAESFRTTKRLPALLWAKAQNAKLPSLPASPPTCRAQHMSAYGNKTQKTKIQRPRKS